MSPEVVIPPPPPPPLVLSSPEQQHAQQGQPPPPPPRHPQAGLGGANTSPLARHLAKFQEGGEAE